MIEVGEAIDLTDEEIDEEINELPDEDEDDWGEEGKAGPKFIFGRPNPKFQQQNRGAYRTSTTSAQVQQELANIEARARAKGLKPSRQAILATYRRNLERRVRSAIRSRSVKKYGRKPSEAAVTATLQRAMRGTGWAALLGSVPAKAMTPVKATLLDDDAFRLLAIPFGGPIPSKDSPRGVDLDGEFFSERTDIKPGWFRARPVDWHHGGDTRLGRTVLGKAVDLEEDDDGWWVKVWLRHGEKRLELIRRLAEQGGQLFGSSESATRFVQKAETGEILAWPYLRQTLSTSPQNTYSVLRPLKATLDDLAEVGETPTAAFFADLAGYIDDLVSTPDELTGEPGEKAGRVIAARNEARLREATDELREHGWNPVLRDLAIRKIAEVLSELERYVTD